MGVCLFGMVIWVDCFALLGSDFLGKDDGCKSGDRGCGWGGSVGVMEVVSGVGMSVRDGGAGNKGDGVVSSEGDGWWRS